MNMNANEALPGFTGSGRYYRHLSGMRFTEGVNALCDHFECYWFLDLVVSYQPQLSREEFQAWTLGKNEDSSAVVICTDGNDNILQTQEIPWTDFAASEATVWVENGVVLLPSEH